MLITIHGSISITPRSAVEVGWTDESEAPDAAASFRLNWSKDAGFDPVLGTETVSAAVSGLTLKRLDTNTLYYVRVRAENEAGASAWLSNSITTA